MGELVSVASQTSITTRVFFTATVPAYSLVRGLQANLQHLFSLQPGDKTRPSWYVVVQDYRGYRVFLTMSYRRTQISRGNLQDLRSPLNQSVSNRVCKPTGIKPSLRRGMKLKLQHIGHKLVPERYLFERSTTILTIRSLMGLFASSESSAAYTADIESFTASALA